jgi:hypothetical protein
VSILAVESSYYDDNGVSGIAGLCNVDLGDDAGDIQEW